MGFRILTHYPGGSDTYFMKWMGRQLRNGRVPGLNPGVPALNQLPNLSEGMLDPARVLAVSQIFLELWVVERTAEPNTVPIEEGNENRGAQARKQ